MKRIPAIDGDEHDAFTGWRKLLIWKPGQLKKAKRKYRKRFRQAEKKMLKRERD